MSDLHDYTCASVNHSTETKKPSTIFRQQLRSLSNLAQVIMSHRLQHSRYLHRASRLLSRENDSKASHGKHHSRQHRNESNESRHRRNQYVYRYQTDPEHYRHDQEKSKSDSSRSTSGRYRYRHPSTNHYRSLAEILKEMIQHERHHIVSVQKATSGEIEDVIWCPCYLSPDIVGHVKGGKARLHHTCRLCHRTCLHLLGKAFSSNRRCLGCDRENNWQVKDIPRWYYHLEKCSHCKRNRK